MEFSKWKIVNILQIKSSNQIKLLVVSTKSGSFLKKKLFSFCCVLQVICHILSCHCLSITISPFLICIRVIYCYGVSTILCRRSVTRCAFVLAEFLFYFIVATDCCRCFVIAAAVVIVVTLCECCILMQYLFVFIFHSLHFIHYVSNNLI